jgi:hypothetical protein
MHTRVSAVYVRSTRLITTSSGEGAGGGGAVASSVVTSCLWERTHAAISPLAWRIVAAVALPPTWLWLDRPGEKGPDGAPGAAKRGATATSTQPSGAHRHVYACIASHRIVVRLSASTTQVGGGEASYGQLAASSFGRIAGLDAATIPRLCLCWMHGWMDSTSTPPMDGWIDFDSPCNASWVAARQVVLIKSSEKLFVCDTDRLCPVLSCHVLFCLFWSSIFDTEPRR